MIMDYNIYLYLYKCISVYVVIWYVCMCMYVGEHVYRPSLLYNPASMTKLNTNNYIYIYI